MNIKTTPANIASYKTYLQVEDAVRLFLEQDHYLRIDLPVLSPALIPESYLEVFKTEFIINNSRENLYLTPSPELYLKRLLAYGVGDCYSLGKAFRNSDPAATLHHMEFTMLEIYKLNASYGDIADMVLRMLRFIARKVYGSEHIRYQGKQISFKQWERLSVEEAFSRYADIHKETLFHHEALKKKAKEKGYTVKGFSYEDVFSQIYVQEVEPRLGRGGFPTLLYDYPKEFAALAKLNPDGKTAQRFEVYIEGIEIGDCYSELTDWKEQLVRFTNEQSIRKKQKKIEHPIDKGFIEALQYGLTDCAGIAMGFERLAMIFADVKSISELKLIQIQ